jgi:hypothetical protein
MAGFRCSGFGLQILSLNPINKEDMGAREKLKRE